MQTTPSATFDNYAKGSMRPYKQRVFMSFAKDYDVTITFFTLDTSYLDSTDVLSGTNSVIQEWDKYTYTEYSHRVISIEWEREQVTPWSVAQAIADITFDNSDDFFTPGSGSVIADNVLPRRPVRIYAGFGSEVITQFIGLTDGMPKLDDKQKTATFHCVDFLASMYNKKLDQTALYQNQRVDQIISSLLTTAGGLTASQLSLDTAFTTIPYAFFDKGEKLGSALDKLVQAEIGRLFMDENGVITFQNRQNFDNSASVYNFNPSNVKDYKTLKEDEISNVVEVKSAILGVQTKQKVYELSQATIIPVGQTIEIWADFQDPVTSIDTPVNIASATTSLWKANTLSDGTGSDYTSLTLTYSLFSKSYKMSFQNTGASDCYITSLVLFGTPVRATADVYERQESSTSTSKFEEQVMTIENKFIQDATSARSLAILLATIYNDYSGISEIDVKGTPALQLNDTVTIDLNGISGSYYISKITNKMVGNGFEQVLQTQRRLVLTFFTLDSSYLDGSDVLAL